MHFVLEKNLLVRAILCAYSRTSSSALAERPRDALCPSVVVASAVYTLSFIIVINIFSFRSFTTAYN